MRSAGLIAVGFDGAVLHDERHAVEALLHLFPVAEYEAQGGGMTFGTEAVVASGVGDDPDTMYRQKSFGFEVEDSVDVFGWHLCTPW